MWGRGRGRGRGGGGGGELAETRAYQRIGLDKKLTTAHHIRIRLAPPPPPFPTPPIMGVVLIGLTNSPHCDLV
jgi:hypothetical protein